MHFEMRDGILISGDESFLRYDFGVNSVPKFSPDGYCPHPHGKGRRAGGVPSIMGMTRFL